MFDNYKDIFNARGAAYHQGMLEQPRAREQEFAAMLRIAEPRDGQTICDMPSGGGYLRNFTGADVTLLCVETSQAFADRVKQTEKMRAILAELHNVPIETGSVDTVISLAGLHHVADRPAVFAEIQRMLKPGGRACFADVTAGSPVDAFLNGFVNHHNSMGHHGEFICDKIRGELAAAGYEINSDRREHFHWTFESEQNMARFCRLLFGLDKADESQTLQGLRDTVGYERAGDRWQMNWELTYLRDPSMSTAGDIVISTPTLTRGGNVSRVEAIVDGTAVWFETSDETFAARPETFAAAFLGPAMAVNRRIRVDAPLDPAWIESVSNIVRLWREWWGYELENPLVAIGAPSRGTEKTTLNEPRLIASCFTGGVDSYYTLLHSTNAPTINRLLFVHGYDIPLADETRMAAWEPALRKIATAVNRPAIVVRTNLRLHPLFRASNWERTHGGALAAVRHAIAAPGGLVIPSSHTYGHPTHWGSHHLTDIFWSSPDRQVAYCDALLNRRQKLRIMATSDEPLLPETLRVCWEGRTPTGNCSMCEKCVRTMIVLHQCDRLEQFKVFDQSIPLADRIAGLGWLAPHLRYVYEGMLEQGLNGEVGQAVRRMLAKSRSPGLVKRAARKAKRILSRLSPRP